MKPTPKALLIDTNVWLDAYTGRRSDSDASERLVDFALGAGIDLLYTATTAKDLFYLIPVTLKRADDLARAAGGGSAANPEDAEHAARTDDVLSAEEVAWAVVDALSEFATVVGADESDVWLAWKYRTVHDDFEDNLLLAAMERSGADYLVTNDVRLLKHSPFATLRPKDMLALLQTVGE